MHMRCALKRTVCPLRFDFEFKLKKIQHATNCVKNKNVNLLYSFPLSHLWAYVCGIHGNNSGNVSNFQAAGNSLTHTPRAHASQAESGGALHLCVRSRRANEHIKVRMFWDEDVWEKSPACVRCWLRKGHTLVARMHSSWFIFIRRFCIYWVRLTSLSRVLNRRRGQRLLPTLAVAHASTAFENKSVKMHMEIAWQCRQAQRCITTCSRYGY